VERRGDQASGSQNTSNIEDSYEKYLKKRPEVQHRTRNNSIFATYSQDPGRKRDQINQQPTSMSPIGKYPNTNVRLQEEIILKPKWKH
jgi:hypothetical protein